ncbi:SemiSWEET transporter [Sporolactobacillus shoreicorticis]|uniref:SemiSWEET family sugar transporter n=1 Tax=Sporolactobacillus shoreicorticis TaxID=1923877 RepID=A0ABW5S4I0_9BACL|nr:SemiSWEET transporter [Sporolactobacillus shoreicorticis]MCO7124401.1 SemiSWEET transporter [Sporolactobacillus shoreicorticis]
MLEIIGFIAGIFTSISFFPQAIKVIKTNQVADISLLTYFMFLMGLALWVVYGLFFHSPSIFICNAISLIPAGIIFIIKAKSIIEKKHARLQN